MRDRVPGALVGLSLLAAFSWHVALADPPASPWGAPRSAADPLVHPVVPNCGNQTSTPPPTKVTSCGGTTNPLTQDNCAKTAVDPTNTGFTATCGASITVTGNTFAADSADWLLFFVPASHATCKTSSRGTPYVSVNLSSSGGILLDV
jgi:hypothetical protein